MRWSIALLVCALAALTPALADADLFRPISLVSQGTTPGSSQSQQADYAHDSAISGNGRYVAFDGSYAGRSGVWRRDLQTGTIEAVAAADPNAPSVSAPDAELPSISENGQYVSFTTTARLDPIDDVNPGPDVYVRNMGVPAEDTCEPGPGSEQACPYTLASAVDGSSAGLTYEPTGKTPVEGEEKNFGSLAAGRSAISADGSKVAFVTTAISNLAGAGTPAMQVAVRDLDSDHTELVSVADEPATGDPLPGQAVSGQEGIETYGAVYSGVGSRTAFSDPAPYGPPADVGASISADGSTVAWMGVDVPEQARLLPGEDPKDSYDEPLWRRIADGPTAPIRRITGGSDTANPQCLASGEAALPGRASLSDPCQGPFDALQEGRNSGIWSGGAGDVVPRLSADGYSVAFLANAPLVALGPSFDAEAQQSDLYLANMHEPLTRVQALRPLTELAGSDQADIAENGAIEDLGISPDGSEIAFTTKRTVFPLGSPAYISEPQAAAGMLELFVVDLSNDTLTRVSEGFDGGPSEHPHEDTTADEDPYQLVGDGALSPSFSDDGNTLAFSSTASNLAFGDGNTPPLVGGRFDGSDAFVVPRIVFTPVPTQQSISPQPAGPPIKAAWRLGVTVRSRADGSVLLYVSVPGAGTAKAGAQSAVRVRAEHHGHASTSVATRSVATTKKVSGANAATLVTLTLTLASRYRSLADKRPGLAGTVNLTFSAAGHPTLRQSVRVSFLRTLKAKKKKQTKKKQKKSNKRSGGTSKSKGSR
jgi:Tol biopolymer transport system component